MAVKKTTKMGDSAAPKAKKAAPKKAAPKKAAPKKAAPKAKKAAPRKAASPKAKKAAPKKAAPKLSDKQLDFLKKVLAAGVEGMEAIKADLRTIESLVEKKLAKKTAKNKTTGLFKVLLTKAGTKHAGTPASTTGA